MTSLRAPIGETSDDELLALVRTDEREAYGELYRRHVGAARSTARWMLHSSQDVDDVVSEAFAGALAALRNGNGPRDNFRFYLLASVRNGCMRRSRKSRSVATDPTSMSEMGPMVETTFGFAEANTVTRAFSTLSPRWQQMLWLTEVERRPIGEVAKEMQMSASAVSAVSQRARHAFASAYLSEHVAVATDPHCAVLGPRLGKYVRGEAGELDTRRIDHHLESCTSCSKTVHDLRDVNACLRELQLPGGLTGIGSAALAATGAAGAGTAGFGGWAATALGGWILKAAIVVLVAAPLVAADSPHGNSVEARPASTTVPTPDSTAPGGITGNGSPAGTGAAAIGASNGTTGSSGGSGTGSGTGATPPLGAIDPTGPVVTLPGGTPVLDGSLPIESVTTPETPTLPGLPGLPGVSVPGVTIPGVNVTVPGVVGVTITVPAGGGVGVGITTPVVGVGATVNGTGVGAGVTVTTPVVAAGVDVGAGTGGVTVGGSVTGGSTSVTVAAGVGGSSGGVTVGAGASTGGATVGAGVTADSGGVTVGGGAAIPPITVVLPLNLPVTIPPIVIPPITIPKIVIDLPHG